MKGIFSTPGDQASLRTGGPPRSYSLEDTLPQNLSLPPSPDVTYPRSPYSLQGLYNQPSPSGLTRCMKTMSSFKTPDLAL